MPKSFKKTGKNIEKQTKDYSKVKNNTTKKAIDTDKDLELLEETFKQVPSNPGALGDFILSKISSEKNLDVIPLISPSLEEGIKVCNDRVKSDIYLPDAFYDIGLFALLLGRLYESLNAYIYAILRSDSVLKMDEEISRLKGLKNALQKTLIEKNNIQIDWPICVLSIAKIGKLLQLIKPLEEKKEIAELKLSRASEKNNSSKEIKKIENNLVLATSSLEKTRIDAEVAKKNYQQILKARKFKKLKNDAPLVIVAGGCDERFKDQIESYRQLVNIAFKDFNGTIYCGGTEAGFSGIIGDLPVSGNKVIRKVAYIPRFISPQIKIHKEYEIHEVESPDFSALEPIQFWIDILASGIDPSDVKVLGINGGKISAFEFRLAIAMGAKVGIIRESGRAASEIFTDENLEGISNLFKLPNDPSTIKVFIQQIPPSKNLTFEDRDAMAREAHNEYRKNQKKRLKPNDPSMAEWDYLPSTLKKSNYHQVDHIEEKLKVIGYKIIKIHKGSIKLKKFSADEIEKMAILEHGRWNAERILEGWTPGIKNAEKKTSPYLVTWSELTEEVKEWDRQAVEGIPALLKKRGYEIVSL